MLASKININASKSIKLPIQLSLVLLLCQSCTNTSSLLTKTRITPFTAASVAPEPSPYFIPVPHILPTPLTVSPTRLTGIPQPTPTPTPGSVASNSVLITIADSPQLPLASLVLAPAKGGIGLVGESVQFFVIAKDIAGQYVDSKQLKLTWHLEKPEQFRVDANGLVTALVNSGYSKLEVTEETSGLKAVADVIQSPYTGSSGGAPTPSASTPTPIPPPVLAGLSSTSQPEGTLIFINGSNFNATTTGNIVKFGSIQATVTAATANQLTVSVPSGLAGTVSVTVESNAQNSNSFSFTVASYNNVAIFAGDGTAGYVDGPLSAAKFNQPTGLARDSTGNIYVSELGNHTIRKITPAGIVSTVAGDGTQGSDDGIGTAARFNQPASITLDSQGNLYIGGYEGHNIRKITSAGVVTTIAGDGTFAYSDGVGTTAKFAKPGDIAFDTQGNFYIADSNNHRIRKMTPDAIVTTFAGDGSNGILDGTGLAAQFSLPAGIMMNSQGNFIVAEWGHVIRQVTLGGVVTTLAGDGNQGLVNGPAATAQFRNPTRVVEDSNGNMYVTEFGNHTVRKITPDRIVSTFVGDGTGGLVNGPLSAVRLNQPAGIVIDNVGNMYITELANHTIRKITY